VSPSSDPDRRAHNLHAPKLFETADGSVVHCACCGRLEIEFRDCTLRLSPDEFDVLTRTVAQADEDIRADPRADARTQTWRLSAETGDGDVSVVLQADELRALDRLLKGAYAMMTLRDSLNAIAQGAGRDVRIDAAFDSGGEDQ